MNRKTIELSLIKNLPLEIEDIIKECLPISVLITLNKQYYKQYHKQFKNLIPRGLYENYVRDMLRKDNDFVFRFVIKENFKIWEKIKKYNYSKTEYGSYFCFIDKYCINNGSTKCRNVLNDFLHKSGLSKNQHKKNNIKNIIWTN
jgi:hypothetical protein